MTNLNMKYSEKDFQEINSIMQEEYGISYIHNGITAPAHWAAAKCNHPEIAIFSLNRKRESLGLTLIY